MPDSDGRDEQPAQGSADGSPSGATSPSVSSGAGTPADASPVAPAGASPLAPADSDPPTPASAAWTAHAPAPSARTPQAGETQLLDPVEDQPTQVMEPVPEEKPERHTPPLAPAPSVPHDDGSVATPGAEASATAPPSTDRNWMGVAAFVAGALFLSVVAIVLGHLGLSAAKRGRADNRGFSIAGLILGYLGLVLTAVGAWLYFGDQTSAEDVDLRAQQDVSAVGAAAATLAFETGGLPDVEQVGADFRVGDETFAPHLTGEPVLSMTGTTATDWCLSIGYEGGEQTAFHYVATSGMAPGPCPDGA